MVVHGVLIIIIMICYTAFLLVALSFSITNNQLLSPHGRTASFAAATDKEAMGDFARRPPRFKPLPHHYKKMRPLSSLQNKLKIVLFTKPAN